MLARQLFHEECTGLYINVEWKFHILPTCKIDKLLVQNTNLSNQVLQYKDFTKKNFLFSIKAVTAAYYTYNNKNRKHENWKFLKGNTPLSPGSQVLNNYEDLLDCKFCNWFDIPSSLVIYRRFSWWKHLDRWKSLNPVFLLENKI